MRWLLTVVVPPLAAWGLSLSGVAGALSGVAWGAGSASVAGADGVASVVASVDAAVAAGWRKAVVEPAPSASDAVLLRRVTLDLAGVTPSLAEARVFLADRSPDKRARLVERLLASPRYASSMAVVWRDLLIPANEGGFERRFQAEGLENWLRDRFARNVRYDNLVYDLLVATDAGDLGPASYFAAHDLKPEKLAASTSERLLGVSLECAQCHDHPFTHWTEDDFWGYAAYFARVRTVDGSAAMTPGTMVAKIVDADTGELRRPEAAESDAPITPRLLGGAADEESPHQSRRERLALWMAERGNPYLARAAVNATWRRLMGVGLVDEISADGAHLPSDHAALLDDLAADFVAANFDLRRLLRVVTASRAYQLAPAGGAPPAPRLFAAMPPRRLSAEQLAASIERLAPPAIAAAAGPMATTPREEFVRRMAATSDDPLRYDGGTLQSLRMLHGELVEGAARPADAGLVPALAAPHLSAAERVDALYLATLTRAPTDAERALVEGFLHEHGGGSDLPAALGDALWSLVNTAEMAFNH